jgi:GTPase
VRRKGRVTEAVEKFSVIKTLQAIEDANVVVLVLDAQQEISDQDAHLAGSSWKPAAPWWWRSTNGTAWTVTDREQIKRELTRRMEFLSFARFHFISALRGRASAKS